MTLYHWDLPAVLDWRERDTAQRFAEFAQLCFDAYGDRVKWWLTINEPWIVGLLGFLLGLHAPGIKDDVLAEVTVFHHLLLAHGLATQAYTGDGQIGLAPNLCPHYPASDDPADTEATWASDGYVNRWFLDPLYKGSYPDDQRKRYERLVGPLRFIQDGDLETIATPTDYLGVNYYAPRVIQAAPGDDPWPWRVIVPDDVRTTGGFTDGVARTDAGTPIVPHGLTDLLVRIHDDYGAPPVLITENGGVFPEPVHDDRRIAFIHDHVAALHDAIDQGVPVRGYCHWSLMDNFEWKLGYAQRFGLVHVDYDTLRAGRERQRPLLRTARARERAGGPMKLAIIGGGSTYTPEVIDGIVRLRELIHVDDLWLHDVNPERLEVVAGLSRRMLARAGHPARLETTTTLDDAVEGADAVLIQIRVGGQAARIVDESLPLACGCLGQETTGFGGLAKALRTVPVVLEIADRARALAPDAWIVDFTNPVGIVTKGLLDAGHRAVGLCSAAMVFQRHFAKVLDLDAARIELDHIGLNHLTWEVGVRLDGEDVLPRLLGEHVEPVARATGLPAELVQRLGTIPSYYLHYFYEHDHVVEEQKRSTSRAELVSEIERELLQLYADEALCEKPELLQQRGGAGYSEAAVELIASLFGSGGERRHVINLRNDGTLPFLADDSVIEVPARVGTDGVRPVALPQLGALERGLVAHISAYEDLALDAALRGGRERVFRALLAHPLVGQAELAETLTDSMLAANRAYLPWA